MLLERLLQGLWRRKEPRFGREKDQATRYKEKPEARPRRAHSKVLRQHQQKESHGLEAVPSRMRKKRVLAVAVCFETRHGLSSNVEGCCVHTHVFLLPFTRSSNKSLLNRPKSLSNLSFLTTLNLSHKILHPARQSISNFRS